MTMDNPQPTPRGRVLAATSGSTPGLRAGYNSEVPDLSKWRQFDREHQPRSRLEIWQRDTALSAKQWSSRWRLWAQSFAQKHW